MRALRLGLWLAVAAALLGYLYLTVLRPPSPERPGIVLNEASTIGGPFRLIDQTGAPFTEADVAGAPHAVFFGFTHCPDVCPTTLFGLGELMKQLGPEADRLRVLFVTVDPERDTPEQLATYLSAFDPRITALTGDAAAIDAMVKTYKAYYRKVPNGDDYTMDHTALVFLMGPDGRFVTTLDMYEPSEIQLGKLRRLLQNSPAN